MGKVRRWMLILCAIFMVFGAQSVYADDTQDSLDGYWSKDENQETEDGETVYRYFLWDGTMITDQWAKIEEEWYFFDANGVMQRGWLWKSGGWYYLDEDGRMLADTVTPDGYRLDNTGAWITESR